MKYLKYQIYESQMNNIVRSPMQMDVGGGENQSYTVQGTETKHMDNPQPGYDK